MKRGHRILLVLLLGFAVILSALGVVYAKYASRKYFVESERLRAERELVDIQWGRLQLEQGTLATHWRVESRARRRLGMQIPDADEIILIRE